MHPFETTFQKLRALDRRFDSLTLARPGNDGSWLRISDLTAQDAARMHQIFECFAHAHPASGSQAHASRWFVGYLNEIMITVFACYLSDHRVPDLHPERIWAQFDEKGKLAALAFPGQEVAGLVGDHEVASAGGLQFGSPAELRDHLRSSLIAHLTPITQALRTCSSFGIPGMWALAADYVAKTLLWVGERMGDETRAVEEARAINLPWSPLHRRRDFIRVENGSRSAYLIERTACCKKHKLLGKTNCASCPHRPLDERVALARAKLSE